MDNEHRMVVEELHEGARRNYPRRKVEIIGLDETFQADSVDMRAYSRVNRGFHYILTVIDIFSKFAWAVPLKSKSGHDLTNAMKSVLNQGRVPKNLHVDQGTEFYNSEHAELMRQRKIHLYSTFSHLKASIIERFNRTIKNKMWKRFSLRGSYAWYDILQELIKEYNNQKHRTIGMKPNDVTKANEAVVLRKYKYRHVKTNPKFKSGDKVRISKSKHVFEKGYTPNWSTEIFTIRRVCRTNPVTYLLKDYLGNPISGGFYEQELSKNKHPDVYLVEKVVGRRKNKLLVKWLGFDSSHNSYIDKDQLKK